MASARPRFSLHAPYSTRTQQQSSDETSSFFDPGASVVSNKQNDEMGPLDILMPLVPEFSQPQ
jgi:hypothetical protein